jgi:hypothetical protein
VSAGDEVEQDVADVGEREVVATRGRVGAEKDRAVGRIGR